jgi:hypothetical protein
VVVTAFIAALVTVVIGAVLLRLLPGNPITEGPATTGDSVRPLERVRELRAVSVMEVSTDERTNRTPAVAVGTDGWVVSLATDGSDPVLLRTTVGTTVSIDRSVHDPGSTAVFLYAPTGFTAVPLATVDARYLGEPLAVLSPTGIAGDVAVAPATLVSTHGLSTEDGAQSSDASPSILRIQVASPPPFGAPVFALSGDLLGLAVGADSSGFVAVLPSWVWASVVRDVLTTGSASRPVLGLTGKPADPHAGGAPGFTVSATATRPAVAKGSAGEAAGIRTGDTVIRVGEDGVTLDHPLADRLFAYRPGDTVVLTIRRSGVDGAVSVTLGRADAP